MRQQIGNSLILVPAVAGIIYDPIGRVLLQKKHDGTCNLPAGAIEPGENPAQAIVREMREETGLTVHPSRIIGIFGGSGSRYRYSNGDEVEYTVVLFACSAKGISENFDGEETERLRYFPPEEMPPLGLGYPRHIFSASEDQNTYFEPTYQT